MAREDSERIDIANSIRSQPKMNTRHSLKADRSIFVFSQDLEVLTGTREMNHSPPRENQPRHLKRLTANVRPVRSENPLPKRYRWIGREPLTVEVQRVGRLQCTLTAEHRAQECGTGTRTGRGKGLRRRPPPRPPVGWPRCVTEGPQTALHVLARWTGLVAGPWPGPPLQGRPWSRPSW